ncbi:MAG: flavodoxin family protein [Candidatus Electrothrix sp. EH2]|nr:flavodoxin family protein [Candidatus Electrothrix sp. EH2]
MVDKKVVILDGTRTEDRHLEPILTLLTDALKKKYTTQIKQFRLRHIEIKHCIGCFNCWVKTPGKCIYNDGGADVLQDILKCDILVLFTPVVFGGYSSELKKIIDRFLPFWLPFFQKIHGETHHPFRYPTLSRLIGIGVHSQPSKNISKCFKMLVGRNAKNLYPTSYTANVISSADSKEKLSSQFQALLTVKDEIPRSNSLISFMNNIPPEVDTVSVGNRTVLLLVGSPKLKKPSTSEVLGFSLLKKLEKRGWKTESLTLSESILKGKEGQKVLFSAVKKAGIILLAFPLYIDTLPFLVIKTLELITRKKKEVMQPYCEKYLLAIINNGFPEAYQNAPALSVCQNFALESGMIWAGGLAMGAGEALLSGQPITGFKGYKSIFRPPLYHVNQALNLTATSLSYGHPVPGKAVQLMMQKPIPFMSFNFWRYIYMQLVKRIVEREVKENGFNKRALYDKPYEQRCSDEKF